MFHIVQKVIHLLKIFLLHKMLGLCSKLQCHFHLKSLHDCNLDIIDDGTLEAQSLASILSFTEMHEMVLMLWEGQGVYTLSDITSEVSFLII
jgi:hypothetical protein